MHFTIENNDGESTLHLLFSLLLCGDRNITPKIRSLIFETTLELSGRIGSDLNIFETYLFKAWCSFFYDGNLIESKKHIDKINSSLSSDLPSSLRQCARKLQIFIEFETLSFDALKNLTTNSQKYIKRFQEYNLSEWAIGNVIFLLQQAQPHLKKSPGDDLFIGNILDEKTDQILLYTHLLFEKGHANAASIISQEAKEAQIRAWFLDPSSHIEYVPEKFAQKIIEYATLKNKLIGASNQKKRHKFLNSIKSISIILSLKKEITSKYWGLDVAIMNNIRIDKSNTQDTEKLHSLAQNAIRTGFHWTAYRLAHKSRTDISTIIQKIKTHIIFQLPSAFSVLSFAHT